MGRKELNQILLLNYSYLLTKKRIKPLKNLIIFKISYF